jgi:hypothetical protein
VYCFTSANLTFQHPIAGQVLSSAVEGMTDDTINVLWTVQERNNPAAVR